MTDNICFDHTSKVVPSRLLFGVRSYSNGHKAVLKKKKNWMIKISPSKYVYIHIKYFNLGNTLIKNNTDGILHISK